MSIDTFTKKVVAALEEEFEAVVTVREVVKNNGLKLTGVTVMPEGAKVCPTIYMEGYYQREQEGSQLFPDIIDDIIDGFRKALEGTPSVSPAEFMDWDWVKSRLGLRLVAGRGNEESLEGAVTYDCLDLKAVLVVNVLDHGQAKVNLDMLGAWGVTQEAAYEAALANLPAPELMSIEDKLRGMMRASGMSEEDIDMQLSFMPSGQAGMYCLTNPEGAWGAAELLKPGVLEAATEQLGGDFFIIPSSVHEVLLVRADGGHDAESLKEMICEVNATQVAPDEVLSNHPYFFGKDEGKLTSLLEDAA